MENVNHEICENNIMVDEFAGIYEIYYERVFKYIFYRVDEQYMAEELCSEVFERIITKYNSFSGNELTRDSWVFTIARNTITDYYRKKKKVFHFSLDYAINMISSKP